MSTLFLIAYLAANQTKKELTRILILSINCTGFGHIWLIVFICSRKTHGLTIRFHHCKHMIHHILADTPRQPGCNPTYLVIEFSPFL